MNHHDLLAGLKSFMEDSLVLPTGQDMEEEALTTLIHQLIEKQKEKRRAEKALTKGKQGM